MLDTVAVYGTLKKGQRANYMLNGCKLLGEARLPGFMYDLGAFPGVTLDGSDPGFVCEVYRVPKNSLKAVMERLDAYEGEGSLYHRRIVKTPYGKAFIYEYAGKSEGRERIEVFG